MRRKVHVPPVCQGMLKILGGYLADPCSIQFRSPTRRIAGCAVFGPWNFEAPATRI